MDVPDQKTKNIPYALREGDAGNGPSPASAAWREAEGGGAAASEKKGKKEDTAKERNKTRNKRAEEVESGGGSESESEQEEAAAKAGEEESGGQRRAIATAQPQSKMTKLFNRKNHDVLSDVYRKMVQVSSDLSPSPSLPLPLSSLPPSLTLSLSLSSALPPSHLALARSIFRLLLLDPSPTRSRLPSINPYNICL